MGYGGVIKSSSNKISGTAMPSDVLAGETFCSDSGVDLVGTMKNNGIINAILDIDTRIVRLEGFYATGSSVMIEHEDTRQVKLSTEDQTIKAEPGKVLDKVFIPGVTGTAETDNVLQGKIFSSASGVNLNGTMVNNGAFITNLTKSKLSVNIPQGYHNGDGSVSVYTEEITASLSTKKQTLTASNDNLISSVIIPAVTGTAKQEEVLNGKTFCSANGVNLYGTMVNHGFETVEASLPSVVDGYLITNIPDDGFYNENSKLKMPIDKNLLASNIKQGVSIFGVEGTVEEYKGFNVSVLAKGNLRIDYSEGYEERTVTYTLTRNYEKVVIYSGNNGIIYCSSSMFVNNTNVGSNLMYSFKGSVGDVIRFVFTKGATHDGAAASFCAGAYIVLAIEKAE